MSEKPVVSDKAWQLLAESKIKTAMEEGEFSQLAGFGKPLPEIDNAVSAEMDWMRDSLKRENLTALPPALQLKKTVALRLLEILELKEEVAVREGIDQLNAWIETENMKVLWGPPSTTTEIDCETVIKRWRLRGNR